jgi:hypothetical protein
VPGVGYHEWQVLREYDSVCLPNERHLCCSTSLWNLCAWNASHLEFDRSEVPLFG